MPKTEAQMRATKKYDAAHYWKPTLYLPRELEEQVRAKANGSISGYVVRLIKADLGITEKEKGTL